jgi:ATP-dependent exoDNAse (exonuclease V) alpha subunit
MQTSFACGLRRQKLNRKNAMAIYHLSVKPISRSDGRSVTAAAAYRAAAKISDERTGELHDYTRKQGVVSVSLITPKLAPKWSQNRSQIWNAAELAETRKNATVAREFEIALPSELNATQRQQLAHEFAQELVTQHGCIADVAIHQPGKEGDQRNHHAHILLSTRRLGPDGFTEKTRELDDYNSGPKWVKKWRERYAQLQNQYLQQAGSEQRVDHRSYKDQGLDSIPTCHLGPSATAYERRTGLPSKKRQNWEEYANQRLLAAKEQGELEREAQEVEASIIVLDTDLKAAKAERDRQPVYPSAKEIEEGKASFLAGYEQSQHIQLAKQQEAAQKREQARLDEIKRLQDIEEKKRLQQLQAQVAQRRKEQRASNLQQWLREADAILNQGLETLETELALAQQAEAKAKVEAEAAALAAQAD